MKQKYKHDPDNGIFGDCYRTCLAYILGLDRDDVPHYITTMDKECWAKEIQPKYDTYLADRGWQELAIPVTEAPLDQILEWSKTRTPFAVRAMLTGRSNTGCNHVVVINNGEVELDPSIDEAGIIGPCDDGFYWVTWIIRT